MRTILITGCGGFIGSHMVERMLFKGWQVVGMDNFDPFYPRKVKEENMDNFISNPKFSFIEGDIRNLEDYPSDPVDAVLHLAAKAGVRPSIENPEEYFDVNVTGTLVLHSWMRKMNVKKLLFSSSSSIYGNNKSIPFKETDNVDFPISPYAASKKSGELINFAEHHLHGLDVLNLRFFTVYGPRQRPDLAIHKFIRKIFNDEPIQMFGDGSTSRDYTYIDDICNGLEKSLEYLLSFRGYEIINLGNNTPIALMDLVSLIYGVIGKQENVERKPMQPGDVKTTYADISKAKQFLGYEPSTTMKQGVATFVDWIQQSMNLAPDEQH